ncbi:DoxX family protein [Vibrio algarum]|uniref:DoxX family protein n=1 Tax=Vibrio algarum TaxID=3020714 RepID=A0ABT4YQE2_9VIBR|nr:DoxX family protein [Vibrio sp. KJ40-1]MDB1123426.1 DoxX family protein [Vibrio sp. KJ40-1]
MHVYKRITNNEKLTQLYLLGTLCKKPPVVPANIASVLRITFSGYNKATMFWMMIMGFDGYGLPVWFMAFLGMAEIAGAISLYLKRWALLGSIGMSTILIAASSIHIMNGDEFKIGGMAWIMTPLMFLVTYYHFRARVKELGITKLGECAIPTS